MQPTTLQGNLIEAPILKRPAQNPGAKSFLLFSISTDSDYELNERGTQIKKKKDRINIFAYDSMIDEISKMSLHKGDLIGVYGQYSRQSYTLGCEEEVDNKVVLRGENARIEIIRKGSQKFPQKMDF